MLNFFQIFKSNDDRRAKFDHVMDFASDLASTNPSALVDLVRLLLRQLQADLLFSCIEMEMHGARSSILSHAFFMPNGPSKLQMAFDAPELDVDQYLVQLRHDAVLPCPWHRERYVNCLSFIGSGKNMGNWKEDSINHRITVWLPWGIAFVNGGNHSIAAGIASGEGVLKPKAVYDMSKLLDQVHCDGLYYRSSETGKKLDSVRDYKIAALFEIGRLMKIHSISPMKIVT
ncbi:DUF6710 family protein [Limnohabitans sp.]|uniref:DUF6710 family protein n=1 Tax=Limnohabitans sp. TaxID=1907725 RepID=UPI00286F9DF1|nr:DUF6710 family protein [Limnohabitans sp.]